VSDVRCMKSWNNVFSSAVGQSFVRLSGGRMPHGGGGEYPTFVGSNHDQRRTTDYRRVTFVHTELLLRKAQTPLLRFQSINIIFNVA